MPSGCVLAENSSPGQTRGSTVDASVHRDSIAHEEHQKASQGVTATHGLSQRTKSRKRFPFLNLRGGAKI